VPPVRDVPVRAANDTAGAAALPRIGGNPIDDLRRRQLLIPVEGYDRGTLRSSFSEPRGSGRVHEAMDLLAPRHTPVLAVEDGRVARLFTSQAGGLTIYQFDPTTSFAYYYAHLERYAPGLQDGSPLRRGQVIGYVGTSGNAPEDTPHLHFAIFRLTAEQQWWNGVPLDPFEVLR
jgi:murein DD-endopeptidase MepM/ murein hydrolase activator NlpD